ncbi:hypothetical protein EC968_005303 [Mortierella alpina]|nr:hypothetical protein EC968_005303 [Mortierella alpina]
METSNDNNNPWSFQQHSQEEEAGQTDFPPHSLKLRLRRNSNSSRHLSFASTTTIAADASEEQFEKDLSFSPGLEYQPDSDRPEHDRRSTRQQPLCDKTRDPDFRETDARELPSRHHSGISSSSTSSSHHTSFSPYQAEKASALWSSVDPVETIQANSLQETTLADSGVGLEGGMLDRQVQKLQSEVADTRAIVFDLESRLNAAENSNKHIVEELKILLADAEGTLVGSDASDSEDSLIVSSKLGSGSDEDSNVVYNRICHALQTLISEAQTALVRTTTTSTTPPLQLDPALRRHPLLLDDTTGSSREGYTDDGEHSQTGAYRHSSCSNSNSNSIISTSRRSSVNSLRVDRPYTHTPTPRLRGHSNRSTFSRMLWKEKQQEQYERYRRSCDRVSLELEMLLHDTILDTSSEPSPSPRLHWSQPTTSSSHSSRGHDLWPPPTTTAQTQSSANYSSVQEQDSTTDALKAGSRVATLQQRSSTTILSSPQPCARGSHLQRQRRHDHHPILAGHPGLLPRTQPYTQTHTPPYPRPLPPDRHFKNQGAGPSRSQSIFVQLYRLWKQTWLRKRIMHVLTGSAEVLLLLYIVLKISEISLEWIGFRMFKGLGPQQWLLYHLYGDGSSLTTTAAAAAAVGGGRVGGRGGGSFEAKELYEKIIGDSIRGRQMDIWRQQERELLMKDYIASEVASGVPRTPFTAAGMIWRPAGRMIAHAVSGIVLAYLSDRVRSIARKL